MFGRCHDFVSESAAQTPYGFHTASNHAQNLALSQAQILTECQRVVEARTPVDNLIDGQPFSGIGIDHPCLANDTFRKSIFAEPQNLLEDLLRKTVLVAALAHAVDQLLLEGLQAALALPSGHRAAQPIRL